jgi:hypothetical protein
MHDVITKYDNAHVHAQRNCPTGQVSPYLADLVLDNYNSIGLVAILGFILLHSAIQTKPILLTQE